MRLVGTCVLANYACGTCRGVGFVSERRWWNVWLGGGVEFRCNWGGEAAIGVGELCETSLPVGATSCVGELLPMLDRIMLRI